MAGLLLALVYLLIVAAFVWQCVHLWRNPSSLSLGGALLLVGTGALLAGIAYFGVLH